LSRLSLNSSDIKSININNKKISTESTDSIEDQVHDSYSMVLNKDKSNKQKRKSFQSWNMSQSKTNLNFNGRKDSDENLKKVKSSSTLITQNTKVN
jgi:hypothetical protein